MCEYCEENETTKKDYTGAMRFKELPIEEEFNGNLCYRCSYIWSTNNKYFLRTHYANTKINYCPMCR